MGRLIFSGAVHDGWLERSQELGVIIRRDEMVHVVEVAEAKCGATFGRIELPDAGWIMLNRTITIEGHRRFQKLAELRDEVVNLDVQLFNSIELKVVGRTLEVL